MTWQLRLVAAEKLLKVHEQGRGDVAVTDQKRRRWLVKMESEVMVDGEYLGVLPDEVGWVSRGHWKKEMENRGCWILLN